MLGVYAALQVLAVLLVAVLMDNSIEGQTDKNNAHNEKAADTSSDQPKSRAGNEESASHVTLQMAIATFKHLRKRRQLLIIPLTIYAGIQQAFLGAEWTGVTHLSHT